MVTPPKLDEESMEDQINGMDRWMSPPVGKFPYFGKAFHGPTPMEASKMDRWKDSALAASHTSEMKSRIHQ